MNFTLLDIHPFGYSLAELAVIAAALVFFSDRILDRMGWNKSSTLLRTENQDLIRINTELTTHNADLETQQKENTVRISELTSEIAVLREQVSELKKRDQEAVLEALRNHEVAAERRSDAHVTVLKQIRDSLQASAVKLDVREQQH